MKDNDILAAEELFPSGHQPPSDYQRAAAAFRDRLRQGCRRADARRRQRRGRRLPARRGRAGFRSCSPSASIPRNCRATIYPKTFSAAAVMVVVCGSATPKRATPNSSSSRGYVHVIGTPRGFLKSGDGGSREWDSYDVIEWIARQPWCDGNIGMVGIGAFASEQFHAARQQPPHLKTIFAYDPRGAYGKFGGFREEYPGGVLHAFRYLMDHFSSFTYARGAPGELPPEKEAKWREAVADPDIRMYPHLHNVLLQKGQHMPRYFDVLIDPFDNEETIAEAESGIQQDHGADLYRRRLVRLHLQDAPRRRADLFQQDSGAEKDAAYRPGPSRPAAACVPRRDAALVRPLAQRHRYRRDGRAAGQILGHGRKPVAPRRRLAAAGNAVDQALSGELGAADAPSRICLRASTTMCRPTCSRRCRRRRPNRIAEAALPHRSAAA